MIHDVTIGEGKTAIITSPRGPGSVKVRRLHFSRAPATLPVLFEEQTLQFPLVDRYRHLGGIINSKATLFLAKSAYWRAARTVFRPAHLPLATKFPIFHATVVSVWFWGIGSWPELSEGEFRYFSTTTWYFWELLLPKRPAFSEPNRSHLDIQSQLQVSSPQALLHEARLRHLVKSFGP